MSETPKSTSRLFMDPKSTWVPISAVTGAAVFCLSVYGWLDSKFNEVKVGFDALKEQNQRIERRIERLEDQVSDRWRKSDMILWIERLKNANTEAGVRLKVPDAD